MLSTMHALQTKAGVGGGMGVCMANSYTAPRCNRLRKRLPRYFVSSTAIIEPCCGLRQSASTGTITRLSASIHDSIHNHIQTPQLL